MKEIAEQWVSSAEVDELARWFKLTGSGYGWFGRGPVKSVLAMKYRVRFSSPERGGGSSADGGGCDFEIAATSLATIEMFVTDRGTYREISFVTPIAGMVDQMRGGGHGRQAAARMLEHFTKKLGELDTKAKRVH